MKPVASQLDVNGASTDSYNGHEDKRVSVLR